MKQHPPKLSIKVSITKSYTSPPEASLFVSPSLEIGLGDGKKLMSQNRHPWLVGLDSMFPLSDH